MIFVVIFLFLALLCYLFSTKGRTGHPGLVKLRKFRYAHRGLHGNDVPENSMKAFRLALEHGFGIELDVHLLADGNLAVIHDSSLQRTVGKNLRIEDLSTEDLSNCYLEGTEETIPEFRQVLELFRGGTPLIVELKTADNAELLTEAACKMLDQYNVDYCIESFDPRCIYWLRKHRPELIRGQLAENYFRTPGCKLPFVAKLTMACQMANFLTKPDFIAYRYSDRNHFSCKLCRKLWKIQGVSWTLRNRKDFDIAVEDDWIPIFEGFIP